MTKSLADMNRIEVGSPLKLLQVSANLKSQGYKVVADSNGKGKRYTARKLTSQASKTIVCTY